MFKEKVSDRGNKAMPVDLDIGPLLERARRIGLKQSHVGEYSSIGIANISRAANHVQDLSYVDWRRAEQFIATCEELQRRSPAPIDWRDARAARAAIDALEKEMQSPPPAPDTSDWQLLAATTPEKLQELAALRGVTMAELSKAIDESLRKFDHTISAMRKTNQEARDLERLRREEFEQQRASR